jgi:4-amino-4-deoxy-L-arabinose transferase-like glycosyltransferase
MDALRGAPRDTSIAATRWHVAALALAAFLLYAFGLSWAPVHLHFDEIRFAEQARRIAETGSDLRGRFLPVYFQMDASVWFHPIGVYLPALAFKLFSVSITALRTPTAVVGTLDVVLCYLLARRMGFPHWTAVMGGALLAVQPAHFIHSRMAVDYLFPVPFVLAWCLLLLRYLDTGSALALFAATSILGAGCYSYIAALALMPLFLLTTLLMLWLERAPVRAWALACSGFAWVLVPAVWFAAAHPEMLGSTLGRYGIVATQLDAFQRIREALTPWFISDRANFYASFFAPGYLFVTGGASLVESTRTAGVFLVWTLPLMLVGFRVALLRYSPSAVLILAGVLLPPIAGAVVNEPFAVGRAMTMVPFAVLLALLGIEHLRGAAPTGGLIKVFQTAAVFAATIGTAYVMYRAIHGAVSGGGVIVVLAALVLFALVYGIRQRGTLTPVVIAILLGCVVQFATFAADYFGDYRSRSAVWFNGNLRGAVSRIVVETNRGAGDVLLDEGVNSIEWFWRFHLAELGRSDLEHRARVLPREQLPGVPLPTGTLFLVPALDATLRAEAEMRGMRIIAIITDPGDRDTPGGTEQPSYVLFEAS